MLLFIKVGERVSYQFLGDPRGCPFVSDGIKGGVLAGGNGVGHDHAVPLVDPDAVPALHAGSQGRVLGVHQQAADFAIVFQVRAQAVILLAALARPADLPGGEGRR